LAGGSGAREVENRGNDGKAGERLLKKQAINGKKSVRQQH
jgi:hypothetical protein